MAVAGALVLLLVGLARGQMAVEPTVEMPPEGIERFIDPEAILGPLECGATKELYGGDIYWLRSANYPEAPDANTKCKWNFEIQEGVEMYLRCRKLDLSCSDGEYLAMEIGRRRRRAKFCETAEGHLRNQRLKLGAKRRPHSLALSYYSQGVGTGFECFLEGANGRLRHFGEPSEHLLNLNPEQVNIPCGSHSKVVGGTEADPHSFPWALFFWIGAGYCGASIISDEWVITAAHCTYGRSAKSMRLYAGCHDLFDGSCAPAYEVSKVFNHPTYRFPYNDISLESPLISLKLTRPITYKSKIYAACLPALPVPTPGHELTIMGWGMPADNIGFSQVLKTATVSTITDKECGDFFDGVDESSVCAYNVTGGTCRGDSGSFVGTIEEEGKPRIDAVVSYGAGACEEGYPVGFQEVHRHLFWIVNVIKEYSTSSSWTFPLPTEETTLRTDSEEDGVTEAESDQAQVIELLAGCLETHHSIYWPFQK